MDLHRCPTCSGVTELHESPLAALSDAFANYVQCGECGSSSDAEGFEPIETGDDDDITEDLF